MPPPAERHGFTRGSQMSIIAHLLSHPRRGAHIVRLSISNELAGIRRAADMVDSFCRRHALPEREANAIHVALDEVLNNVIRHGCADSKPHAISVSLNMSAGEITLEVEDDGVPFDPTQVGVPVLGGPLSERKIGGLGLVFVCALTDSIAYRRVANRNCLVLRWRVAGVPAAPHPPPVFRVSESVHGAGRVVAVEGRLDSAAARPFRDRLFDTIRAGASRLAIDLGRVSYVGSAGIWALLAAENLATAQGGALVVFGLSSELAQLFERTGIAGMLRLCETREEALAALQPAAPQ